MQHTFHAQHTISPLCYAGLPLKNTVVYIPASPIFPVSYISCMYTHTTVFTCKLLLVVNPHLTDLMAAKQLLIKTMVIFTIEKIRGVVLSIHYFHHFGSLHHHSGF